MAVGHEYAPFIGEWDTDVFYYKSSVVYLSGALYQCQNDSIGSDPSLGPPWVDVTATPVELLLDSYDPTAGDGLPAAVGSMFVDPSAGVYFKTSTADTDWTIITAPA